VTGTTEARRSVLGKNPLQVLFRTSGGRFLLFSAVVIGAIGGYLLGLDLAYQDIAATKQLIRQLQAETQKFKKQIIDQNAVQVALQDKLKLAQAALNQIMPSKDTYNITPNQSLIVADGRLTIGLIGSPTNEGVNININGKQFSAASGDVIHAALDPSTTCQVGVQSFDMFKAVLRASCAAAKPQ